MDYSQDQDPTKELIELQLKIVGKDYEWARQYNLDWPDMFTVTLEQKRQFRNDAMSLLERVTDWSYEKRRIELEWHMRVFFFKVKPK